MIEMIEMIEIKVDVNALVQLLLTIDGQELRYEELHWCLASKHKTSNLVDHANVVYKARENLPENNLHVVHSLVTLDFGEKAMKS